MLASPSLSMNEVASSDLLLDTMKVLGVQPLEAGQDACSFRHADFDIRLTLRHRETGAYVSGRLRVDTILPDREPQQILQALYLNAGLHDALHFPLWLGLDPADDTMLLFFGSASHRLDAQLVAQLVNQACDVAMRNDLLKAPDAA